MPGSPCAGHHDRRREDQLPSKHLLCREPHAHARTTSGCHQNPLIRVPNRRCHHAGRCHALMSWKSLSHFPNRRFFFVGKGAFIPPAGASGTVPTCFRFGKTQRPIRARAGAKRHRQPSACILPPRPAPADHRPPVREEKDDWERSSAIEQSQRYSFLMSPRLEDRLAEELRS